MAKAFVVREPVLLGREIQAILSGTVKDGTDNPLSREIRLYRYEDYGNLGWLAMLPRAVTTSDAETGAFSFTVNESDKMEWVVVCVGEDGENVLAFNHVRVS